MKVNSFKFHYQYLIYAILTFIISLVLCIVFYNSISFNKTFKINYLENADIDYNVCLKENDFFEYDCLNKAYLTKDSKSLVTKLIDNIFVNYRYTMSFNQAVSGKVKYYIKGVIEANKVNQEAGNYWNKEYILVEEQELTLNKNKEYAFNLGTSINYDEYNELLNEFKKNYNVSIDGIFKITLVVEEDIKGNEFENSTKITREKTVKFPLTKTSTEISIDSKDTSEKGSIIENHDSDPSILYTIAFIGFIIPTVLSFAVIVIIIILLINEKKKHRLAISQVKSILKTYDSIIVNIDKLPNLDKYNVITVNKFEELIDAHGEVRMPINYSVQGKKHYFILISNDMAWIYKVTTE